MLRLCDLFPVQQAEAVLKQVLSAQSGLLLVVGPEGWTAKEGKSAEVSASAGLLPSGRSMVFSTLVEEILETRPNSGAVLVTRQPGSIHFSRSLRKRVRELDVKPPNNFPERIFEAAGYQPELLLVDRLDEQTIAPILETALRGQLVLTQLDSAYRASTVYWQMVDMGATPEQLLDLSWVLAIQRLPTLCPHCRTIASPNQADLDHLDRLLAGVGLELPVMPLPSGSPSPFYTATGCPQCRFSGRQGESGVIEICQFVSGRPQVQLPVELCLWGLVQRGQLSLEDLLYFDQQQLRRAYNTWKASERLLTESAAALERTRSELLAASRVLERRNRALFSFQDIGFALIRSDDLPDLAQRICRHAIAICGAERAVLYILKPEDRVEVAGVLGWEGSQVSTNVAFDKVFRKGRGEGPLPFDGLPPGISLSSGVEKAGDVGIDTMPKSGLFQILRSQGERVGAIVIQSMQKKLFVPGDLAMLQTFANQAAVALQRAGLVEELRQKIAQLESAQEELAEKERMQHEMELARQVQQSVLPHTFPEIQGYTFAARYAAARQVGGDFYDVIDLDEDHFGVTIADVSDKGMPAALYMALTRSLLVAQARRDRSPAQVLREVNRLLLELSTSDMFVTVFYGILDKHSLHLQYARAGHDRPFLLRQGDSFDLGGAGAALGVMQDKSLQLEELQVSLEPGDRLVLFTDGLTDVSSTEKEFFGRERLSGLLTACAHLPSDELCRAVFDVLSTFQGMEEQFDDMTMLVVDVER